MAKTKINCLHCNKEIYVENKEIKRGFGKFCNRLCSNLYRAAHVPPLKLNVVCAWCSKPFHMAESKTALSKSGLYFCCRLHKDQAQRLEGGIKEIMPDHYGNGNGKYSYRQTTLNNRPAVCERCGYDNHISAIVIHHKDRNRENNISSNLEILCANCHAIEHWGE